MRLSLKESRTKALNATNLDRKSGIRGPKTMGDPDFLLRAASDDHGCGSPQREPHADHQSHGSQQEIRGKPINSL
jgi:hypothetical protein